MTRKLILLLSSSECRIKVQMKTQPDYGGSQIAQVSQGDLKPADSTLAMEHIWKVMPFKVASFTWLLARKVVLTQENLKKRRFSLCSRCYLCGEEAETVTHLFLQCRMTIHNCGGFLLVSGALAGLCLTKSLTYSIIGRKQEQKLQIETDGGLSQLVSGGQFGKKGILDVLRAKTLICR